MPYWLALITPSCPSPADAPRPRAEPMHDVAQQRAIGCWALQFTPRVVLLDEAVLLEVQPSLRLFGGARALCERVAREARELGCDAMARAPTALAALAFARVAPPSARTPWRQRLDALPLAALSAAAEHEALLERLGCRTLGQVRALPRAGVSRRCGAAFVEALDQAYGERPESLAWLSLPETFEARLELPGRVEDAGALMFGARRLLLQMCGWLTARHAGVRRFVLHWRHDFHRPGVDDAGELEVRVAELTREPEHLCRLLAELLGHVQLEGPVGELRLQADEAEPLTFESRGLALEATRTVREGESLAQLLERLSARLGADKVLRPVLCSDHRPEAMQQWVPAAEWTPATRPPPMPDGLPQPGWLLAEPLPLQTRQNRPHYHGVLQLLAGPHRIEAGWWAVQPGVPGRVARDYFVAFNERVGLLWIYRERVPAGAAGWFLQGVFG